MNNCSVTRKPIGRKKKQVDGDKMLLPNIVVALYKKTTVETGIDREQVLEDVDIERFKQTHKVRAAPANLTRHKYSVASYTLSGVHYMGLID